MKTLEITMMIAATNTNEAERIAQRELMELAKVVGKRSGSSMACGEGNATTDSCCTYKVEAKVQIDGVGDINEIVKETQHAWMGKPGILNSLIFVKEEKKEEEPQPALHTCKHCGQIIMAGSETIVNRSMDDEHYLCEDCFEDLVDDEDIAYCEICDNWVSNGNIVKNPVTGAYNICPICGEIIDFD